MLVAEQGITQLMYAFLMCNTGAGCKYQIHTITQYQPSMKEDVFLVIHSIHKIRRCSWGCYIWGLLALPFTPLLTLCSVCRYIYKDQVQLCRTLLLRFISPHRVIHIPLDRMNAPVPCRLCKNHFPMEVRSASTDTLTCLGLMPPY